MFKHPDPNKELKRQYKESKHPYDKDVGTQISFLRLSGGIILLGLAFVSTFAFSHGLMNYIFGLGFVLGGMYEVLEIWRAEHIRTPSGYMYDMRKYSKPRIPLKFRIPILFMVAVLYTIFYNR